MDFEKDIFFIEHHLSHAASAFLASPFKETAILTLDGVGEWTTAAYGIGKGSSIELIKEIRFPHSIGLLYNAFTYYLGFRVNSDEYKVMGLAAFSEPALLDEMRKIVKLKSNGLFELDLQHFIHHSEGVTMSWEAGEPKMGAVYSKDMERVLGPSRKPDEPIEKRHEAVAASLQAMYEKAFFHLLNHVYQKTRLPYLCLAGGCAMNSVANGKIFDNTPSTQRIVPS